MFPYLGRALTWYHILDRSDHPTSIRMLAVHSNRSASSSEASSGRSYSSSSSMSHASYDDRTRRPPSQASSSATSAGASGPPIRPSQSGQPHGENERSYHAAAGRGFPLAAAGESVAGFAASDLSSIPAASATTSGHSRLTSKFPLPRLRSHASSAARNEHGVGAGAQRDAVLLDGIGNPLIWQDKRDRNASDVVNRRTAAQEAAETKARWTKAKWLLLLSVLVVSRAVH